MGFLSEALEEVVACRRVLKYTYLMGFYLFQDSCDNEIGFLEDLNHAIELSLTSDDSSVETIESYQVALKKRHIDNQVQRRLLFENHQVY